MNAARTAPDRTAAASPHTGGAYPALSVLVVTNMYPTIDRPHYGTFVAEQVDALRGLDDIEAVDVFFVDGRKSAANYFRAVRQLRRMVTQKRYDLVHAHHGLAGAIAVTQADVPVVITFHGSDLSYYTWQRWVSRIAARRAAINICVSAGATEKVHPPGVHLPCGIDLASFAPPRDRVAARIAYEVPDDAIALLFPGPRQHPQKGYRRFEAVRDALRARGHRVHELRLENIKRPSVPELFAAADVLVMTSVSEGSPVSIMEALAGGVPIVATAVGDIPAMVDGVPGCFVGQYDCETFVDAIERTAGVGARMPTIRSRRFDQERIIAGLRGLYGEVVGG